jgi:hypothetical protein
MKAVFYERQHNLESGPDGHVNPFVDIEIIVIGNSYPAASRL